MALLKTFPLDPDAGYGFEWLRAMLETANLQEGVLNAGDFKVTPAAAGGQRVDVAAGWALVKGDSGLPALGLTQGLYLQGNDAAIANALTLANGGANPRVDQIVLTVSDTSDLGSASNTPTLAVVQGAETAGTTLDTRAGAAALPANSVRLADVLVPAGSSAVTAPNVRDRRPWARGAYRRLALTGSGPTTVSGTYVQVSSALQARIECSGAPLKMTLRGRWQNSGVSTQFLRPTIDAAGADGVSDWYGGAPAAANADVPLNTEYVSPAPAAGSHLVEWYFRAGGNTAMFSGGAGSPLVATVEEIVRPNADNT